MRNFFVGILVSFIGFFTMNGYSQKSDRPFIVVLDAGHGGHDSGNTGFNGKYKESDIALSIVLKVGEVLEKMPNVKVVYTRKSDVFIGLRERAAIANKNHADLFVSVHCNAHKSQAHGAETFVLGLHKNQANFEVAKRENEVIYLEENYEEKYEGFDPQSPDSFIGMMLMQEAYLEQSILLASLVQENIVKNLKVVDRSVKQAGFWVLHNTYMPSVLIETGFLTNAKEGAYLNSKKGQSDMAREIAKAIQTYISSITISDVSFIPNHEVPVTLEHEEPVKATEKDIYEGVVFKVQLAAGSRKLNPTPSNFKGLQGVTRESEDNLYKYYIGNTSDYNEAQVLRTEAHQKGFNTAYIVAYKDGKRVDLTKILESKNK
ncbi:MAG: N-acetylmuramoyl-L-alanine amidase [Bacteroidetes bacterium]|jgi:N-acetylmuramoyl-L-alanine amidase|nr:N-acetylmuramoyl-L-alanine amidase [Bacteroidota bacterium]